MNEEPSLNSVFDNLNARCSATAVTEPLHSICIVPFRRFHSDFFVVVWVSIMNEETLFYFRTVMHNRTVMQG